MSQYCKFALKKLSLLPLIYGLTSALIFAANPAFAQEKAFTSESDASLVVNKGNTESQSVSLKTLNKYTLMEKNNFSLRGEYFQTKGEVDNQSELTSENSLIELKYERMITEKMGTFVIGTWSKDNFKGFEERIELGAGLSYHFFKEEDLKFFTEQGYLYRNETAHIAGPPSGPETDDHFWRSYFEASKKFREGLSGRFWVESKHNLEDKDDVEVKVEPSLAVVLSHNISLTLAYRLSYDNVPPVTDPPRERFDHLYTAGLRLTF